jgi:hypothetical protein
LTTRSWPSVLSLALLPVLVRNRRHIWEAGQEVVRQRRNLLRVPPLDQVRRLVRPLRPLPWRIFHGPRPAGLDGRASRAWQRGTAHTDASRHGRTDLPRRADGGRILLLVALLLAQGDALGPFRHLARKIRIPGTLVKASCRGVEEQVAWVRRASNAAVDVTSLGQQHSTPKKLLYAITPPPLTPPSTFYRTSLPYASPNQPPTPQWHRP